LKKIKGQIILKEIEKKLLERQGEMVTEKELCRIFGVSRGPIREALEHLEKEGAIERRKGKGTSLRKLSIKEISELFDVRAVLEGLAARLACENIRKKDMEELKRMDKKQLKSARENRETDLEEMVFHQKIIALSENSFIGKILENFSILSRTFQIYHLASVATKYNTSPYSHQKIINALATGDPDKAEETMRLHVQYAKQKLIELFVGRINLFTRGKT